MDSSVSNDFPSSNDDRPITVCDDFDELMSTQNNSDLHGFHLTCKSRRTVGGECYSTTGADYAHASGANFGGISSPMTPGLSEVLTAAAKQDKDYVGYDVSLPKSGIAVRPSDFPGCRPQVSTPLTGWQHLAAEAR